MHRKSRGKSDFSSSAGCATEDDRAANSRERIQQCLEKGIITHPGPLSSPRGRMFSFIGALVLIVFASIVYQIWKSQLVTPIELPDGAHVAIALFAGTAALFAYNQWIDVRRESSVDKFYERVGLVNQRYYKWKEARQLVSNLWGEARTERQFRRVMYVYLELDNLEHVITRYQMGFVSKDLLERALRSFDSRCVSSEFRILAKDLVQRAGYRPEIIALVKKLDEHWELMGDRTSISHTPNAT